LTMSHSVPHHAYKLGQIRQQLDHEQQNHNPHQKGGDVPVSVGGGLCDVELVCMDGSLVCHSTMLAAASNMWRQILESLKSQLGILELVTVLLPDMPCILVSGVLGLLYSGNMERTSTSELDQTIKLISQIFPDLNLAVGEENSECLVLEVTLNNCNNILVPATTLETVVTHQHHHPAVEDEQERNLEGYLRSGQTETMIKWSKAETSENECDLFSDTATAMDLNEDGLGDPIENTEPIEDNTNVMSAKENTDPAEFLNMNKNFLNIAEDSKKDNKSCHECGKVFLYPKDLKKHMLVHMKIFPFCCKLCQKGVRTISNMYKHLRQRHFLTDDLKSYILDDQGNQYIDVKEAIKKEVAEGRIDPELLTVEKVMERGSVGHNKNGVTLYQCLVCDQHVTKYSLKNHLSVHNGEDSYKCDICSKSYYTNSALSNHKINIHQQQKGKHFKCSNCYRTFRSLLVRDHHMLNCMQVDPSKKKTAFECRLCNKMFGYKNNLVSHQKTFHGFLGKKILEYPCKHCGEIIRGKLKLSKHIIAAHPDAKGELCDLCGKSFATEIKLLRHISVHKSRERNLHCSYCPKKFFRRDVLNVHEKVHTSPVICTECGKKFPEQRYLDNHMVLHAEKKYECHYCPRSYVTEELLKKHYKTHSNTLSHNCNFCPKGFRSKSELNKHKLEHSDEFPLKCSICHKGFLHDSQLEKHIDIVHSKASKLVIFCQHCPADGTGQEFSSLYSLKRHLARHKCALVTKDQKCDICEKDPETYYKLRNHIKINQSKKILPCININCDKKFKTLQELNIHSVVHTGQKPFSCQLCGEKFTQKCSLKTHYNRHKTGTVGLGSFTCTTCNKTCKTFAALKSHSRSHDQNAASTTPSTSMISSSLTPADQPGAFPNILFQPDLLSLDQLAQFQVTTINIEGLEVNQGDNENLITLEQGVATLVGEVGEYKIQIIDDLSRM